MALIDSDLYLDVRDLVQVSRVPSEADRWELRFARGGWTTSVVVSGKFKDDVLRRLADDATSA